MNALIDVEWRLQHLAMEGGRGTARSARFVRKFIARIIQIGIAFENIWLYDCCISRRFDIRRIYTTTSDNKVACECVD